MLPRVETQQLPAAAALSALASAGAIRSPCFLPQAKPRYAGYIAWRGTLSESEASADLVSFFDNRFTFSDARSGGHALCYLIPGDEVAEEMRRAAARELHPRFAELIAATPEPFVQVILDLAVPRMRFGRVCKYEGTRLGRQELNAEILDDVPGALWSRALIEETRWPVHRKTLSALPTVAERSATS